MRRGSGICICMIGRDFFELWELILKLMKGKDDFCKVYLLSYVKFGSKLRIKLLRVLILGSEFSFVILFILLFCLILFLFLRFGVGIIGFEWIFVKFWFLNKLEVLLISWEGLLWWVLWCNVVIDFVFEERRCLL